MIKMRIEERCKEIYSSITKKERQSAKLRSRNKYKKEKGITLIALVVTIVVLLILAGVTITVLFGDNGIFKTAENAALQTKLSEIEERANIIYADLNNKKYVEGNLNKKITMLDIKTELEKIDSEKYQIRIENLEGSSIKAINLDQTSIKLRKGGTATIEATFEIEEKGNTHYYVKVEEKYYEISIKNNHITLDKTNGKTEGQIENAGTGAEQNKEITAVSSDDTVVTIINPITQTATGANIQITAKEKIGTASITVSYEGVASKECSVAVTIQPIAGIEPDPSTSITTEFGKIDVVWLDKNNHIVSEPEKPILQSKANPAEGEKVKMKPIKWEGTEEKPADETNSQNDWYEYKAVEGKEDNITSHWANAKTENGSYFVWIPRYAYRITYYKSETDHTITGYYDGNGMWSAETGAVKYALEEGIETIEAEDGNKYIVHPAFGTSNQKVEETNEQYATRKTQNIDNGGWGEALTGFWFAKFEMSGETAEELKSIPEVISINQSIGKLYTMSRMATYGQTGTMDSFDNKTSFMNSHMVKNSEWGAVAYLTYSNYGRNGQNITINDNRSYYTAGSNTTNAYLSNQNQSTTGNVYGIYDMRGGRLEYTATFNNTDSNGYFGNTSEWTSNTNITTSSNSTKYATKYKNNSSESEGNIIYTITKTGDGLKEVYSESTKNGWFGQRLGVVYSDIPFFRRGGNYSSGTNGGIFSSEPWLGNKSGGLRCTLNYDEFYS